MAALWSSLVTAVKSYVVQSPACVVVGSGSLALFLSTFIVLWIGGHAPPLCAAARGCQEQVLVPEETPLVQRSVIGLAVLLVIEVCNLAVSEMEEPLVVWGASRQRTPTLYLCWLYLVLGICQASYLFGFEVWHAMPPQPNIEESSRWRPVPSTRMLEWCLTVPVFQVLMGYWIMNRPWPEVWPAMYATVVYIIIAWQALVMETPTSRWILVIVSFWGYYVASVDMVRWVVIPMRKGLPVVTLRACLVIGHVIAYGLYGVVFLLAMLDQISPATEQFTYTTLDITSKVSTAAVVSMILKADLCFTGITMAAKTMEANKLMSSLLRASCSAVLCCWISSSGSCETEKEQDAEEVSKLETMLGASVVGRDFGEVVAGTHNRAQFKTFIRNAWLQARSLDVKRDVEVQSLGCGTASGSIPVTSPQAPLAHILHSQLRTVSVGQSSQSSGTMGATILVSIPVQKSTAIWDDDDDDADQNFQALLGIRIEPVWKMGCKASAPDAKESNDESEALTEEIRWRSSPSASKPDEASEARMPSGRATRGPGHAQQTPCAASSEDKRRLRSHGVAPSKPQRTAQAEPDIAFANQLERSLFARLSTAYSKSVPAAPRQGAIKSGESTAKLRESALHLGSTLLQLLQASAAESQVDADVANDPSRLAGCVTELVGIFAEALQVEPQCAIAEEATQALQEGLAASLTARSSADLDPVAEAAGKLVAVLNDALRRRAPATQQGSEEIPPSPGVEEGQSGEEEKQESPPDAADPGSELETLPA